MIYCKIKNGVVINRAEFDGELPKDWPDAADWLQDDTAQIGWTMNVHGVFEPPPIPLLIVPAVHNVKAEAGRRIEAIMPDYKQRNVLAFGLETVMAYGADPSQWPEPLQQVNAEMQAKWEAIKAIRARSNEIEAMDPIPTDFRNDKHWPNA